MYRYYRTSVRVKQRRTISLLTMFEGQGEWVPVKKKKGKMIRKRIKKEEEKTVTS